MTTYKGFSTIGKVKKFRLTDFELAKRDLLNHLNIRKGERLMQKNFGTIIWDMLFEPLTDEVKSLISNDLIEIVSYDPRLRINSMNIIEYDHGLQLQLGITFIPTNQVEQMLITFDQNTVK